MANQERKVELKVGVDATEARQGFNEVKTGARDMAQAVVTEGSKAGKAIGGIGDGGQESAKKTEAATRSMIQSIQRATAAMEAGSKSSSQYYEALASQRGVNVDALKPYLAQLEAVEAKQKQAAAALNSGAASMDKMGVSAKQTAAAMRGVPAQMTDIFTSLQGGQAPMTVLLQQGGQLKDMFGGIGPAARALGGYIAGMINPITLAAAAVAGLAVAYRSGASEGEEFRKTLILTGNALGLTADKMQAMSQRIGAVVGTQHRAAEAINVMASSAKVGGTGLESMTAAALRWQEATGTAVSETAKAFADLAKNPLEASLKLNDAMNYLTDSVYRQIKALQDAGKASEAAALAQKAYADALNDRAPKMVENLGLIESAWKRIKTAAAGAWDVALSIGRDKTFEDQLKSQAGAVDALQQKLESLRSRGMATGNLPAQLDAAKALLKTLQEQAAATETAADADRKRVEQLERGKRITDYTDDKGRKTRAQQVRDELEKERGAYEARKKDAAGNAKDLLAIEDAYRNAVANIRDKYKEKTGGGGISATDTELAGLRGRLEAEKQLATQLASSGGAVAKLNEGEKLSLQYSEKLALAKSAETRARLTSLKALADELGAQQRANTDVQEFAKQQQQYADAQAKLVETIHSKAAAMEAENAVYGLGKDAVEQMTIARLEERKAVLQGFDGSEEQIKLIEQEIDARKRLMEATSQKESLDANKKAAEQAAADWKKSTDQIEQALTNALMEGGKSGKEYIEGLFRTMILRPIVSAVVNPISSAIGSVLGGGSSGGGFNLAQAGQQANSLYGLYNNAGAYYNYAANTLFGSSIPAATGAAFGGVGGLASGVFGAGAGASIYGSGVAGAAYGANAGLSLYGTGTAMSLSGGTAGLSASAGSAGAAAGMTGAMAVPIAGWIAAGMAMADSMFAKGWDAQKVDFTGFGKVTGSATMAFDKLLRGIGMSDRLANVISGASIHAALFGRKKPEVQASGIEGDFTADGFEGGTFTDWKAKGGWFRRSKSWTERAALDEMQAATLQGAVSGALGFYRNLDKLAGGAGMAEREDSFSYRVRADMRGEGALDKVLTDMSNALGRHVLPDLLRFQREGESVADTAQRLTDVFSATNTAAEVLGKTTEQAFGALGLSTARTRQQLIDVAGGLEAFSGKVSTYYDIYYSQEEKLTRLRSRLADSFDDLGVAMPTTMDGFRSLVESLDLTTDSGQEMFSTLLDLAPAFAQASQAMTAFGKQVADFQKSLRLGDLSTLTPEQQYAEAKRQFDATSAAALSGDSDAQAQWTQIAQAFLQASRNFFASGAQYGADFAAVQGFRPNGSHANGLAYVPFDGYVAELHQGERVLTRAENASYSGPDWSKYGRGESAALVAEIRSLTAQVAALKETVRQVEQAKEAQAEARHAEARALQAKQIRLQQQLVDK